MARKKKTNFLELIEGQRQTSKREKFNGSSYGSSGRSKRSGCRVLLGMSYCN